MSILGISGSSVSLYSGDATNDSSLLALNPKYIRSDEWGVRTPLVIGQYNAGFASNREVGVGRHDMGVLYDLPTDDWSMILKPQMWAYRVLPLDMAFAFEWWAVAALVVIASYSLLLLVTGDLWWSVAGSLLLWASPFLHWWYLPGTFTSIGFGIGATAAFVAALRAPRVASAVALTMLSAWLAACFAVLFYPPSQVSVGLVVGSVAVASGLSLIRQKAVGARRVLVCAASVALLSGAALGAFVLTHSDAISAISHTSYPGERRVAGGDGQLAHLTSAVYSWANVEHEDALGTAVFPNASEASSFLPLGVAAILGLPFVWRRLKISRLERSVLSGCMISFGILLLHMYVGLPAVAARLTLLDRVPTKRAIIGIGVASTVIVVLLGRTLARSRLTRRQTAVPSIVSSLVLATAVILTGLRLRSGGAELSIGAILVTAMFTGGLVVLYFWRPRAAVLVTIAFGVVAAVLVNPLQRGLGPLESSPLTELVKQTAESSTDAQGVWLGEAPYSSAHLTAAGVPTISAVNLYPESDDWTVLDPSGASREVWNRYANTVWLLDTGADHPTFDLLGDDSVAVTTNPCGPELARLGVQFIVTAAPMDAPCFAPAGESVGPHDAPNYVYERSAP